MKKTDVIQPLAMASAFAEGVYSATSTDDFEIPAATSTGVNDTCVLDDGFLPITSTALDDGGIAPERKNFNGMFYLSTDQRFYLQNGGFITYNPAVATAIGGYPQDAILGYIDSFGTYKLVKSLIDDNTNNFVSDETLIDGTHWEEIQMGGSSRNIGEIVTSTIPLDDAGLHLLDGSLISGSGSYAAFVSYMADLYDSGDYTDKFDTEANWQTAVTTYGVCGKFVYDDVNNTVRLPKYSNKIYTKSIESTANVAGTGKVLGLTDGVNTGALSRQPTYSTNGASLFALTSLPADVGVSTSAAYQFTNTYRGVGVVTNGANSGLVAQLSNITASVDGYWYIVIATTAKTDIQVDIDEIATDLNGKADVDLTNLNNSGTAAGAGLAMPSDTYDSLTIGASGATYTAPANGWFTVHGSIALGGAALFNMANATNGIGACCLNWNAASGGVYIEGCVPVKKGDEIVILYSTGNITSFANTLFKFVYAQGSEWEK